MGNWGSTEDDSVMDEQTEPLTKDQTEKGLKPVTLEKNNAEGEEEKTGTDPDSGISDEERNNDNENDKNVKAVVDVDEYKNDEAEVKESNEENDKEDTIQEREAINEEIDQNGKIQEKGDEKDVDESDKIIVVKAVENSDDTEQGNKEPSEEEKLKVSDNRTANGKEINGKEKINGKDEINDKDEINGKDEFNGKKGEKRTERVDSQGDDDVIVTVAGKDDVDAASTYSLFMEKDFRYYFQHPYCRLFFAYFVVFCNFLIYAEDPVAHSRKECLIPMVGNSFAFVGTRYPPNAWSLLKVLLWLTGIVIGMVIGKLLVHGLLFNRLFRLKMFTEDQGSWMIMFLITLITVFIASLLYNGFLAIGGEATRAYRISDLMGVSNDIFMKAAACGTWCGDFFTAWMITDIMLQEKLYPGWARPVRRWWARGWNRIILFWIVVVVSSFIVIFVIATDYINWDRLNHDFLPTNELSRAFLAAFILVMDLMIVMQDWDFPHFMSAIDIKLPGVNTAHIRFSIPKCLKKESWNVHITGKWFNYGILFLVMILDMNMWKNQIFYYPYDYGQYTGPEDRIYTVQDHYSLETFNKTLINFDYRNSTINPKTNQTYVSTDTFMNSRYYSFHLGVKAIAFIPSLCMFITFGVLVWMFGRFKPTQSDPYAGRLKKRIKKKKRFSFRISWKRREEIRRKIHAVPKLLYFKRKGSSKTAVEIEEKEIPAEGFSSPDKENKVDVEENIKVHENNNTEQNEKSKRKLPSIPKVLLFWQKKDKSETEGDIEQKEILPQKSSDKEKEEDDDDDDDKNVDVRNGDESEIKGEDLNENVKITDDSVTIEADQTENGKEVQDTVKIDVEKEN